MKTVRSRHIEGFTLIEVLIALAVASFCLISISGLLSAALSINQNLILQTKATEIISSVVEDVGSTPNTLATSARYQISLPTAGSTAATTTSLYFDRDGNVLPNANLALFSISITIQPPPPNQKLATILSSITYWPPYSNSETTNQQLAQHSIQFTSTLNRN